MPQMHLYLKKAVAEEVRRRAESQGLSISAYLAGVVESAVQDSWPVGYLAEVIGCTEDDPLERPATLGWDARDALQ